MSFFRLGMTNATAGRRLKSVGNCENGRCVVRAGRFTKLIHGACFRAYEPDSQVVEPATGRPSE